MSTCMRIAEKDKTLERRQSRSYANISNSRLTPAPPNKFVDMELLVPSRICSFSSSSLCDRRKSCSRRIFSLSSVRVFGVNVDSGRRSSSPESTLTWNSVKGPVFQEEVALRSSKCTIEENEERYGEKDGISEKIPCQGS